MSRSEAPTLRVERFAEIEVQEETRPARPNLLLEGPEFTTAVDDCPWWLSGPEPEPDPVAQEELDDEEPTNVRALLMVFAPEPVEEDFPDESDDSYDDLHTCVFDKSDPIPRDDQRTGGSETDSRSKESHSQVSTLSPQERWWWWRRCMGRRR